VHGGLRTRLFGYADERKMKRRLIADQKKTIDSPLDTTDVDRATEIAGIPERIRGCGHVKQAHLHKAGRARPGCWHNGKTLRVVQAASSAILAAGTICRYLSPYTAAGRTRIHKEAVRCPSGTQSNPAI
jgi:hypothetical protein